MFFICNLQWTFFRYTFLNALIEVIFHKIFVKHTLLFVLGARFFVYLINIDVLGTWQVHAHKGVPNFWCPVKSDVKFNYTHVGLDQDRSWSFFFFTTSKKKAKLVYHEPNGTVAFAKPLSKGLSHKYIQVTII